MKARALLSSGNGLVLACPVDSTMTTESQLASVTQGEDEDSAFCPRNPMEVRKVLQTIDDRETLLFDSCRR